MKRIASSHLFVAVGLLGASAVASAQSKKAPESERRALPPPFASPPLPSGEYQGYPLVGVPPAPVDSPFMSWLHGTSFGDLLERNRIQAYGWLNASMNVSQAHDSNAPTSYWIAANRPMLNQALLRVERQVDSAQTDHVDWGFRSTLLYGSDYRFMTAGGWFSDQLLRHNNLYGFDATEQYLDVYTPDFGEGTIVRVGRWIACPDIETQFAPDNFMGTHSLLFTFDTYTQTGLMVTTMLDKQWSVQAGIHAGTDMAPWYEGAVPTGMAGVRWVSLDNGDSVYLVLNAINNAKFQRFTVDGQPAGHDNYNYLVGTWQHKIDETLQTRTESYFMWQRDAVVGGTPSLGPTRYYGSDGGLGADIPGTTLTYGAVNYTVLQTSDRDYVTLRNEVWRDEDGARSGFAGTYTSHAIGLTHNFSPWFQVRPEVGYYRNWNRPAFDLGRRRGIVLAGFDVTLRF